VRKLASQFCHTYTKLVLNTGMQCFSYHALQHHNHPTMTVTMTWLGKCWKRRNPKASTWQLTHTHIVSSKLDQTWWNYTVTSGSDAATARQICYKAANQFPNFAFTYLYNWHWASPCACTLQQGLVLKACVKYSDMSQNSHRNLFIPQCPAYDSARQLQLQCSVSMNLVQVAT